MFWKFLKLLSSQEQQEKKVENLFGIFHLGAMGSSNLIKLLDRHVLKVVLYY
jgi:hypothetical protein